MPKIHLRRPSRAKTCCGRTTTTKVVTTNLTGSTTCGSCRRTKRFKAALKTENQKLKTSPAPAIRKAAPEIEEVASYLARGFHDWDAERNWPPRHHYLEPGVRTLHSYIHAQTGQAVTELDPAWETEAEHLRFTPNPDFPIRRDITVKLDGLRDDWEDDFRRALGQWAKFGLNFIEVNHWKPDYGRMIYLPDIIADDERAGSYLHSNFSTAIDGIGQRYVQGAPVVHTSLRKINIHKRTRERSLLRHCLHEIGHALGLGHPGPYPQCEVDPAGIGAPTNCSHMGHVGMRKVPNPYLFPGDHTGNTVMSYRVRGAGEKLGPADKLAIEMLYG